MRGTDTDCDTVGRAVGRAVGSASVAQDELRPLRVNDTRLEWDAAEWGVAVAAGISKQVNYKRLGDNFKGESSLR